MGKLRWVRPATGMLLVALAGCSSAATPPSPGPAPASRPVSSPPSSAAPTPRPSSSSSQPRASVAPAIPSDGWRIASAGRKFGTAATDTRPQPLEGYADRASVLPGAPVRLFVSTADARWRATTYRMGWYGTHQGARVARSGWRPGMRQAAVRTVGATHTPVARWRSQLALNTTGWRPGAYLIRLETGAHASYVPLTVRSASTRGRLVLIAPDTTWQAYNDWGGRNLYWGPSGKGDYAHRARAVSFDRPYAYSNGASEFLSRMLPVVSLAERLALPLAYADDVDLHRYPHLLDGARGVVTMGHDEYWSVAMRQSVTRARDTGTNVAFLGANAVFRRIRLQSTSLGPDRLEVNYKDPAEDPVSASHPAQTTADWPANPRPDDEASLTGEPYACFPGQGDLVVADAGSWLLAGTGLHRGDKIPRALGPEFDAVAGHSGPKNVHVVLRSPVSCGHYSHADATYYSAPSGAGVFETGTMGWVAGLGGRDGSTTRILERRITTTLLVAFAAGPAGRLHPTH